MDFFKKTKHSIKLRSGTARPNPNGEGLQRVFQIDNRRAEHFASLLHTPQDVVTADTLWEMLQKKIRDARKLDLSSVFELSLPFLRTCLNHVENPMQLSYEEYSRPRLGDCTENFNDKVSYEIELKPLMYIEEPSLDQQFNMYENMSEEEIQAWNESIKKTIEKYSKASKNKRINARPAVKLETEAEFHERSRYRLVSNDDVPEGWNELQESLPPSLLDEDCLGSFGDWLSRTPDDIQYILMGDTNHTNDDLASWRIGGAYLESLKFAGVTDLVLEYPLEAKPFIDAFYEGKISNQKVLSDALSTVIPKRLSPNVYAELIANAKQLGIRVHALDEQLLNPGDIRSPRFMFDRCAHDKVLSERIKECVGDRKTAILYGAAHYRYEDSLIEQLGVDSCKVVDVYSDLEDYKTGSPALTVSSATHVPSYAYILDKDTVVMTNGDYLRKKSANFDIFVESINMGAQEVEIEKFKSRFVERYTSESNPELNGVTLGSVVSDVYWYRRAVKSGFSAPSI